MHDDVWPVRHGERTRLGSFNGIGLQMMGFTRPDDSGRCFATRWFTFLGLPLIPLGRYYLTQGGITYAGAGLYSETTTRYTLHGRSHLRAGELLRTYAFCWVIGPGIVLVPILLLLSHADQATEATSLWLVLGGFIGWLFAGIFIDVYLLSVYRKRWAPVRAVRWRGGASHM